MRVKPQIIIRTFKHTLSVSKTAQILAIHRSTVHRWLEKARRIDGTYSEKGLERLFECHKCLDR